MKKIEGFVSVLLICLISLIILVVIGIAYKNQRQTQAPQSTEKMPKAEEELPKITLSSGKIAYVQNGDLYLLDESGVTRLTSTGKVGELKWSRDGKFLGWINLKEARKTYFHSPDGVSISLMDLQTGKIEEVVQEILDDGSPNLYDFDFSNDSTKLVYSRDGVWLRDIKTGKEEKIAENDNDEPGFGHTYVDVSWNPMYDVILLHKIQMDGGSSEIYKIQDKQREDIDLQTSGPGFWSSDGVSIYSHLTYLFGPDLWITNWRTKISNKIVDGEVPVPAADSKNLAMIWTIAEVAISKENKIIAWFSTLREEEDIGSDVDSRLYLIELDQPVKQLTKDTTLDRYRRYQRLSWSTDSTKITYLGRSSPSEKHLDLYIIDADGSNEKKLLTNVHSYAWSPVD